MASQKTKSRSSNQNRRRGGARRASEKTEEYRFARNVGGEGTVAELEYRNYVASDKGEPPDAPDVLLAVPVVKVDSIHLELDDLDAHVALRAHALNHYVKLHVGVDVHFDKVRVDIKGVETQALVRVRLDHVTSIVDRVLTTLDRNPKLLESIGEAVEDIGAGAGKTLEETGGAVKHVGKGAKGAVQDVGKGAGQAVGDVGEGAGQAVGEIGKGAGEGVGELGEGAGQAVGDVGQGAGQAVGNLDQTLGGLGETAGQAVGGLGQAVGGVGQGVGQLGEGVGQVGQGAGQAVGGVGQGVGEVAGQAGQAVGGLGQAAGQVGQGAQGQAQGAAQQGAAPGQQPAGGDGTGTPHPGTQVAKEAAKTVAKELGSAASDEAKDLGMAATRKVKELGARRRERRAEKHHATEAAMRAAEELDVDLDEVEGTGADGRITVGDVRKAAEA
jgi:e3 binding domain